MPRIGQVCEVFGLFLVIFTGPALAHHSTAPYDLVHGTLIGGVVKRFDWENPHAHLYLDVAGENDATEHWTIELESPNVLRRMGWTKDTLRPGDRIAVTGSRAKNGSFNMRGGYVQLPDGRKMPALANQEN